MITFESLEECMLTRYQYLVDEFTPENDTSQIVFSFEQYCKGCIEMFWVIYPDAPYKEIRPFFHEMENQRPLQSINEAYHWVNLLVGKLAAVLNKNA